MSESRHFFHFSYLGSNINASRIHQIRDGDAFAELSAALQLQGYKYKGLIINYPQPDFNDFPEFKPTDLLVLTTRPPIHDKYAVRPLIKSKTKLEQDILDTLEKYLESCTREHILISKDFAKDFDRSEIRFHVSRDNKHDGQRSRYKQYRNGHAKFGTEEHKWHFPDIQNTTATYMILTKIENGPMLLNAFGMGGQITLIWCHLLRTKYPELLESPKLVMAEIITESKPKSPATLSFTNSMKVDILLNVSL